MDPFVAAYLQNLLGLLGMLLGIGLIYMLLLAACAVLLSRWWGGGTGRAFWFSNVICLVVVIITISIFEGVSGLFRHDPPGVSGLYRPDWSAYATTVEAVFFTLYGLVIALSAAIGYIVGQRRGGQGKWASVAAALAMLTFLILTLPIVDFANACLIGRPFILPTRC